MTREEAMREGERRVVLKRLAALYALDAHLAELTLEAVEKQVGRNFIRRIVRARELEILPRIEKLRRKMLGYWTEDGLDDEDVHLTNPFPIPPLHLGT